MKRRHPDPARPHIFRRNGYWWVTIARYLDVETAVLNMKACEYAITRNGDDWCEETRGLRL